MVISKQITNKIKKEVMTNVAKSISNAKVVDKKWIKTPNMLIRVYASRDYTNSGMGIDNWYGIEKTDLTQDHHKAFVFTTGDPEKVLIIPPEDIQKNFLNYLRETDRGYFLSVKWYNNRCFIPRNSAPKKLRDKISDDGIALDKYVNNFSILGTSHEKYLKQFNSKPQLTVVIENQDLSTMIKTIAEKDPTFLTKSTEEKLIIIRYNQIKQQ